MSERIDAYAHIGLPRFASAEQLLRVMDRHRIDKAVVAAADTCPDIGEVSRAISVYPDRFRGVGVPQGESITEISASLRRQAQAGFMGVRIFDRTIAEHPALLGVLAESGLVPYVVGGSALEPAAGLLADFLEGGSERVVVAPHFGGAAEPGVLEGGGACARLFAHPRFLVIFSRHGAYDPSLVRAWAASLAVRLGWGRILFGSEFPVFFWRNESYQSTLDWVKGLGVGLDEEAFYGQNALRHLWARPLAPAGRLVSPPRGVPGRVPLFTRGGFELPEGLQERLITRYLSEESREEYRDFITRVMAEAAGGMPESPA